jgi:hypothetical protein
VLRDGIEPNSVAGRSLGDRGAAWSYTGGVFWTVLVPFNFATQERLDRSTAVAFLQAARRDGSVPIEALVGMRRDGALSAFTTSEGITGAATLPIASMTFQTASTRASMASLEAVAAFGAPPLGSLERIGGNLPAPVGTATGLARGAPAPLSALGSVSQDGREPGAWLSVARRDFPVALSIWHVTTAETLNAGVPLEWRRVVSRDGSARLSTLSRVQRDFVIIGYHTEFPFTPSPARYLASGGNNRLIVSGGQSRILGPLGNNRLDVGT